LKATLSRPTRSRVIEGKEVALTVTVVICTRNRPGLLRECLGAVSRLDPKPDEVLVVDNTQGDRDTENAAAEFGARYTIESVTGLSRARNRGLAESNTDIVAYLDDDAIPERDWLGVLLAPFEDDSLAASTGRVVTPDSDHQLRIPRTLSNRVPEWFEIATFGGMGLGSNMAFRRSVCPQPMFDTRLGRGGPFEIGEESYALARLLTNNYKAVYQPTAIVLHPPLSRGTIEHEARNSITYWLLLFKEFPEQRMSLAKFLIRRLRHKPLNWVRDPQEPGEIVTSRWRVLLKAAIQALWLFLKTPKPKAR
jgi:O-antigen biosynthesis protein